MYKLKQQVDIDDWFECEYFTFERSVGQEVYYQNMNDHLEHAIILGKEHELIVA